MVEFWTGVGILLALVAVVAPMTPWLNNPWIVVGIWLGVVIVCVVLVSTNWSKVVSAIAAHSVIASGIVGAYAFLAVGGLFHTYLVPRAVLAANAENRTEAQSVKQIASLLNPISDEAYRELVAEVIHSFEPKAFISVGGSVLGPDGARTVDIQVWPADRSANAPVVIDVFSKPDGNPVGISSVDIADSKRRDLSARMMFLCSNTGFDPDAIRKAKRLDIRLISVLKHGDKRANVLEEIYLRRIDIHPAVMTFDGATVEDGKILGKNMTTSQDVTYGRNGLLSTWLANRAGVIAMMNPLLSGKELRATFAFKSPTEFKVKGRRVKLKGIAVQFTPKLRWLSQVVTIDARSGIYDYVRRRAKLAPGQNSYTIAGVDFDKATPMSSPPDPADMGFGRKLSPGEFDMFLGLVERVAPPPGFEMANLNPLIKDEDLSPLIVDPPKQ